MFYNYLNKSASCFVRLGRLTKERNLFSEAFSCSITLYLKSNVKTYRFNLYNKMSTVTFYASINVVFFQAP